MAPSRISHSGTPESLVVALAQAGDRDAFEELVRRRQSWVRNLMRRCSGDPELADDLAQQVFLQAWRKLAQLQKPGSFGAWLKRMAISIWLQHSRRNDALRGADEDLDAAATQDPPTGMTMDLDRALSTLPVAVRTCVVLFCQERMTHGEISEATGLPLGTVKSHIRRGTVRLQQLLAAYRPSEKINER